MATSGVAVEMSDSSNAATWPHWLVQCHRQRHVAGRTEHVLPGSWIASISGDVLADQAADGWDPCQGLDGRLSMVFLASKAFTSGDSDGTQSARQDAFSFVENGAHMVQQRMRMSQRADQMLADGSQQAFA